MNCLNDRSITVKGYLTENSGLEKANLVNDLEKENNTNSMVLENEQAVRVVPHVYKTYHYSQQFEYIDTRPDTLKKIMGF